VAVDIKEKGSDFNPLREAFFNETFRLASRSIGMGSGFQALPRRLTNRFRSTPHADL
jgi:hypothetical protein